MYQKILFQHNQIQLPEANKGSLPMSVLVTIMSNISYYGYALSLQGFRSISTCDENDVSVWWKDVEPVFKALTGDDKNMADFVVYKNFPQEVMDMSESEYWRKQIFMYWGFPNEMFTEPEEKREALSEELSVRVLHPAREDSLPKIAMGMLQMPNRWTDEQIKDIAFLVKYWSGLQDKALWTDFSKLSDVSFKENMTLLASFLLEQGMNAEVGTATDILRLAASMSGGDVSLREKCKFRSFRRKERKFLLKMLENTTHLEEDFVRHKNTWGKLLYALRPGDYAKRFPRVVAGYDKLYNNKLPKTFSSRLEAFLAQKDAQALALLKSRPGEFLRRLHVCLLLFGQSAADAFVEILPKLQTIQLLKIHRYLETINEHLFRTYAPRGNWTKLQVAENEDKRKVDDVICSHLLGQIGATLEERLRDSVPAVALDEASSMVKLQTNDSDLSPYGRGTAFPIPENIKFLRTAVFWKSGVTQANIWYDNGWNFFDDKWNAKGACCWNQTSFDKKAAVFSGDPTNSKEMEGRACQMIDLYLDKLSKRGVRYAVWNVLCFSKISFDDAEEVHAALQWGEDAQKGKLFEPSRCQLSFPLKGKNFTKYIAYIDLKKRQVVYMDANLYAKVESAGQNTDSLAEVMPAFVEYLDGLPSVFDLFKHQTRSEDGISILYNDKDLDLEGKEAYIFRPENQHNTYEPLDLNELLASKHKEPENVETGTNLDEVRA